MTKEPKLIAITSGKGGTGKSSISYGLGYTLAKQENRTLIIELDFGLRCLDLMFGMEDSVKYDLSNVLKGNMQLLDAVARVPGVRDLEILCAPKNAFMIATAKQIADICRSIRKFYDFIIIDCPPSLGLLTVNALTAAQSILIPIQCEYYALEGVTALMNTVQRVKRGLNPGLEIEGVLLTMLDGRTNLGLQVVAEVKKHFKSQVFKTTVPRTVRLGEAPSHGLPIHMYDPRSSGTEAYMALSQEVIKKNKNLK